MRIAAILKDDGESASGAIAISRGWAIATDDKQATNLFRREKPNLEILSTPEILQYWAQKKKIRTLLDFWRVKCILRYSPAGEGVEGTIETQRTQRLIELI